MDTQTRINCLKRRKREILDQIQTISERKRKLDLLFFFPTFGISMIFTKLIFGKKIESLEKDFLALSELEKRLDKFYHNNDNNKHNWISSNKIGS